MVEAKASWRDGKNCSHWKMKARWNGRNPSRALRL
jgi:hypothetical protein